MKKRNRWPYVAQFFRGNLLTLFFALLSTAVIGGVNLVVAWLLLKMVDKASGMGTYTLLDFALMTLGVLGAILGAKAIAYFSKPRFIARAMTQYKAFAFEKLTRKSIAAFQKEATAEYLSAFSNDIAVIETGFVQLLFDILFDCVLLFGAVGMMLYYSPLLTLAAGVLILMPIGAALVTGKQMIQVEQRVSDQNGRFLAALKDILTGFPVVKSFKAEKAILGQFRESNEKLEEEKCRKQKTVTVLGALGGAGSMAAQLGTFLVGICLVQWGYGITPGVLILFMDLTANVIHPISNLPSYMGRSKAALALIDKLAAALETNIREEGETIPGELNREIRLENVSFGYEPADPVLKNIRFRFEAGKSYAIVGASGSGKTTLLKLLMASYPDYSGQIFYDDHALRDISCESLYDIVTLIQQDVFVFNDTIRNNVTLFQPFPEEEVAQALERSGLGELMARQGENYLCGENGNNLSGGEKQRIAIARGLLRKAPVLMADEATASLDRETASRVTEAILNQKELTRIVVTHTLDAPILRRYDCILVLKHGRITETGSFDELMERTGDFFSLYTAS